MVEMNKKPLKKPQNLLAMSENEIEKQKNTIADGGDDLFRGFNDNKPKPKP